MADLIEEVKESFRYVRQSGDDSAVSVAFTDAEEAGTKYAPGFLASRMYYHEMVTVMVRRGYRQYAGSTMPTSADELVSHTGQTMTSMLVRLLLEAFSDGVLIGHHSDQIVKMAFHFKEVDGLFENPEFREASSMVALNFTRDTEIMDFFVEYFMTGTDSLSHLVGWAHTEDVEQVKIWDLWQLIGVASCSSSYLAGHRLGVTWKERDVLTGIEAASEVIDGAKGDAGVQRSSDEESEGGLDSD